MIEGKMSDLHLYAAPEVMKYLIPPFRLSHFRELIVYGGKKFNNFFLSAQRTFFFPTPPKHFVQANSPFWASRETPNLVMRTLIHRGDNYQLMCEYIFTCCGFVNHGSL